MNRCRMFSDSRYFNVVWKYIDYCSHGLMFPWLVCTSFCLACYLSTTKDTLQFRIVHCLLIGPVCGICSICLFPFGTAGFILWVMLCVVSNPSPYSYWKCPKVQNLYKNAAATGLVPNQFTITTANVCLLPEFLSRYNNLAFTYCRSKEIARRILKCCVSSVNSGNMKRTPETSDDFGIASQFSSMDFICFQEVWERVTAWFMMSVLRHRFKYFVYDVGQYGIRTNLFCLGSGLMFVSRYRILAVDFHSFKIKTRVSSLVSLGLLQVKVELYKGEKKKLVGYVATTHLQSYQGKKPCILAQLDQCVGWLRRFRTSTLQRNEVVAFDIFCGDFNFDNFSPADSKPSNHALFEEYADPCRIRMGCDEKWTIGTEMRQRMLWSNQINCPDKFKHALENSSLRRYFMLDADVKIHTVELAFLKPPYDEKGQLLASPTGGKRRVDYILYHTSWPVEVLRYNFVTALNQLTDHIPITMTFRILQ